MKGGGKCLADLRCRHSSADLGKLHLLSSDRRMSSVVSVSKGSAPSGFDYSSDD